MQHIRQDGLSVGRERAFLLGIGQPGGRHSGEHDLDELELLTESAGAVIVDRALQRRKRIDPGYYIGRGKAEEIAERVRSQDIDVVICDEDLSPGQVRNLERVIGVKVVDRSELILDIFASHARTQQARLQVELAQLEYALPRLTRMWSHLNRYEGGIGTRGPGEKQLEVDRRLVQRHIRDLKRDLKGIDERKLREVRSRRSFLQVSLVGYTNAGKSTLMNHLTDADVLVEDKLFATLDTRTRKWKLDSHVAVLLSDTVGFIRKLPHHLVASFQATLEEARHADLLLHVVDASHPEAMAQAEAVLATLDEIGCHQTPKLTVLNKSDLVVDPVLVHNLRERFREPVLISALTGDGVDELRNVVAELCSSRMVEVVIEVPAGDGRIHALLASECRILSQEHDAQAGRYRVMLRRALIGRLEAMGAVIREEPSGAQSL